MNESKSLTNYQKYGRKYYEKNKEKQLERNRKVREKWRKEWWEFKSGLQCNRCGENHPATIDFHHTNPGDPENKKVNQLAAAGLYKRAYEEVKKCEVLCANCHRKHHYEENQNKCQP